MDIFTDLTQRLPPATNFFVRVPYFHRYATNFVIEPRTFIWLDYSTELNEKFGKA